MTISSNTRKAGPFVGNGSASTFPFTFKVFQATDLLVVKLTVSTNIETNLVLNTDYTVSLNANQNSNPGGSITLSAGALASGYNLAITSDIENLQPTDLTNQGGFYPEVITDALDRATVQIQQLQESVDRSAKLPLTSAQDADALVADLIRLADSADNIDTVAGSITNVNAVAANATNINTVAGSIGSVNTVAGSIAAVNTVATDIAKVNTVSTNIANVNTVAGISGNVTTVAGIAANVTAVAGNATNINIVAGNNTNISTVAGVSTAVSTVAGISGNVTTVAGISSSVTTVAGISANVTTVAGISSSVTTVATNNASVVTVATNIASVNSAVTNMAAIIDAPNQAAAAAASAAAAAASAASGMYSAVQDKSADYTVLLADAGDLIRMTTSGGARTVTLPAISGLPDGFNISVVKWTGDSNAVTVTRSGSDLINGSTSYVLDAQYKSATFVADKESSTWFASGSGSAASNIVVDNFTGDGSTVAFTLSGDPGSKNNTLAHIAAAYQLKSAYTQSGSTITFSAAPPNGQPIEIQWSQPLAIGTPADGTVSVLKLADGALAATTTGLAKMADGFFTATTGALAKFADGFLAATTAGRAKMADLFVTTAKLADAAVTTVKIADANVTDAKIAAMAASKLSGAVPYANLPAGSVLQVVNFASNTITNTTSTSFVDTTITVSITPKFATSKILVTVYGQAGCGTSTFVKTQIVRNSTSLCLMWNAQFYPSGNSRGTVALTYFDSPATTSATTYKLQVASVGGGAVQINPDSGLDTSSITVMEIAQ